MIRGGSGVIGVEGVDLRLWGSVFYRVFCSALVEVGGSVRVEGIELWVGVVFV